MTATRVLVLGAAGRDFHDFAVALRDDPAIEVVGFTAAQIPGIEARRFPAALAGPRYPDGIAIHAEAELERLIGELRVDEVVLAYSDLAHATVMHLASRALAAGAGFRLLAPARTMLRASRPVIAVTAVRTGCGKSQVARYLAALLRGRGYRVGVCRHPMPYGDLTAQRVQRFASIADLDAAGVTLEEREDYEPHVLAGSVVHAGVDYAQVLRAAEAESDVVVWDGGNNDTPFVRPDLWITVVDPFRAGHELAYHPGEVNFRAADLILINKADTAPPGTIERLCAAAAEVNPRARLVIARSQVTTDDPALIRGRRVLLVEDGPTLTHGELPFGAGFVAARHHGAAAIVDPRPHAVGEIAALYRRHPHLGAALPAVGYSPAQLRDLEATIRATPCDTVIVATPADLGHVLTLDRPSTRVRYELAEHGAPTLADELAGFLAALPPPTWTAT
ncbi:MAG: GTPase [Kofleriaceae bacterium]|nr:GTPase [Kofleriaceae bacterium]MCL4224973.1 cyclic 2,3-diphosphoglycerate synthase [Myxococcales bacterium]